jgi:uncharacterized protein with FMN-binding domain
MRRTITTLLTAAALSLPIVDATAAVNATARKVVVTKTFAGPTVSVDRWGDLQVTISVRKTTTVTGTKKKVARKILAVSVPTYPNHTDRSQVINERAIPILRSETLQAQSASVELVSGATDTSESYMRSLQAAIVKAKRS